MVKKKASIWEYLVGFLVLLITVAIGVACLSSFFNITLPGMTKLTKSEDAVMPLVPVELSKQHQVIMSLCLEGHEYFVSVISDQFPYGALAIKLTDKGMPVKCNQ